MIAHAILPRTTVMSVSEEPSSLFLWETSRNPSILNSPSEWPVFKRHCLLLDLCRQIIERLTSPSVGEAAIEAHLENCNSIGTVLLCSQFICASKLLYIVCNEEEQGRFSVFRSTGISNSSMALPWLTSMYGPFWDLVSNDFCPVKVTSFQSSERIWKYVFQIWSKRVVPFRFHVFERNHFQWDWWYLQRFSL